MVDLIHRILQQANTVQRTTALNPLGWMLLTLVAALVGAIQAGGAAWLQTALLVLVCAAAGAYLLAYAYFAWTQPDALRSEKFGGF